MLIFYLEIMLPLFGIKGLELNITVVQIANNSWYLFRIPFALVVISRYAIKKFIGDKWFNQNLFLCFSYYFDSSTFYVSHV
jgi:ACR3 family arsenite transporter